MSDSTLTAAQLRERRRQKILARGEDRMAKLMGSASPQEASAVAPVEAATEKAPEAPKPPTAPVEQQQPPSPPKPEPTKPIVEPSEPAAPSPKEPTPSTKGPVLELPRDVAADRVRASRAVQRYMRAAATAMIGLFCGLCTLLQPCDTVGSLYTKTARVFFTQDFFPFVKKLAVAQFTNPSSAEPSACFATATDSTTLFGQFGTTSPLLLLLGCQLAIAVTFKLMAPKPQAGPSSSQGGAWAVMRVLFAVRKFAEDSLLLLFVYLATVSAPYYLAQSKAVSSAM